MRESGLTINDMLEGTSSTKMATLTKVNTSMESRRAKELILGITAKCMKDYGRKV